MTACVAEQVLTAKFAIIGIIIDTIVVIAQLLNFNKLLKKSNIDFEQNMVSDFKRIILGENNN